MKKIFIIILLLTVFNTIYSENPMVITIENALELTKKNNISLKRAEIGLETKKRDKDSAFNVFYPKISGSAVFARSNTIPDQGSEYNLILGYDASFTFTPALFNAVTLLKKNYELGEVSYNKAVQEIELAVKEIFFNIILLKEQISLLEDNLKTIKKRYDLTKLNYDAGLVSGLELLTIRVSYENFKPELYNLNNLYITTIMNFKSVLGLKLDQDIVIEGKIEPVIEELNIEELYLKAVQNNKDLKTITKLTEFHVAQKKATFSQSFLPVINIGYSSSNILNDPINNDTFLDDTGSFSLSLLYSFTGLLPGSQERVDLKNLDNIIADDDLQSKSLKDNLKLQITNLVYVLNNSIKIQDGLKLTEELAKKSLSNVQQAYNSGTAQLLEVENAENEYKKSRLELLKEKFNYTNNQLKLETIISVQ